jgi:hypothetical protein
MGFSERPLQHLPILTKEMVMEHFDELVTDPALRLADVEAHLATLSGEDELRLRQGARDAALDDPTIAAGKDRIRKELRRRHSPWPT